MICDHQGVLLLYRYAESLSYRNDLDPVPVRIIDEIDSHGRILETDASHLLMSLMKCIEFIRDKSQVKLLIAQIIGLLLVPHPGELQLEVCPSVLEKDNLVTAVFSFFFPGNFETDGLFVKSNTLFKIQDIKVKMRKLNHNPSLLLSF